ncbi:N-acetylmuramoyl-L-alanine amidase [Verrucomicrobiaceae bacterium N1E253]|uniref:N-acetylmuramoyl-L-alanine amidase n=1 Tax=Oceaniferula marina TaxID=2748318 RepID=A0A851GHL2_9BACT|nr:N-acetylmuramoyl-L-alanine amidase [Oceaniferula marina]NWK54617.1 N-acetylmuramoyl-L-alanine amidase [Oceaniferula marina]
MSTAVKFVITTLVVLLLGSVAFILFLHQQLQEAPNPFERPPTASESESQEEASPLPDGSAVTVVPGGHDTTLADLGTRPDWHMLDLWQETITRENFTRLLTQIYTVDDSWKRYITIKPDHAVIRTDTTKPNTYYELKFSHGYNDSSPDRSWKSIDDLPPATTNKPLADLRIAIDPGHIGGEFAKVEQRWFQIGDNKPVMEGELTLTTARLIKRQLINLGAKAYLTRGTNEPVNPHRPEFYRELATAKARSLGKTDEQTIQYFQNKFFYLTGEIRARARRINLAFRPDLVLCLHYNAERWDDPENPTLTNKNHYHVLLHGALTSAELAHDDERFEMLTKILQHNHEQEKGLGIAIAKSLAKATKLPAYNYQPHSKRARKVKGAEGLWARNLLANRIYQCPVIFPEPYVMNNQEVHDRVQLGNYKGKKKINGVDRKSIQREYADAVVEGIKNYYLANRIIYTP